MTSSFNVCPFCGDVFENRKTCPVHDLPLVSPADTNADTNAEPTGVQSSLELADDDVTDVDTPVEFYDVTSGRGFLHAAGILLLVGFVLPFVNATDPSNAHPTVHEAPFALALHDAPNLWTIPAIALALFSILAVRRTRRQMRGARLAVLAMCIFPVTAVAYSLVRITGVAAFVDDSMIVNVDVGVYAIGAACVLTILGGLQFGGSSS